MKKFLLSFFGLILCSALGWGGPSSPQLSVTKTVKDLGLTAATQSLTLNSDITITTVKGNGAIKGTTAVPTWRTYVPNSFGPVTITAETGYAVEKINFDYTTGNNAVFCKESGVSKTSYYSPNTDISINATTKTLYTSSKGSDQTTGYIDFKSFTVFYYKIPTTITLPETMTIAVGDTFQIGQVYPFDAYYTWSSDDENKIVVDTCGVIVARATTSGPVAIKLKSIGIEKTCSVTVVAGGGKSWTEKFSNITGGSTTTDEALVEGDDGVKDKWRVKVYRLSSKFSGKGIQLRYDDNKGSSLAANGTLEGGVKSLAFLWSPQNNVNENHFRINVDNQEYIFHAGKLDNAASVVYHYRRTFDVQKNTTFSIVVDKKRDPQQSFPIIGPITVIPYLYYSTKSVTLTKSQVENTYKYKYTNNDIINNTGVELTSDAISYSISGTNAAKIAKIKNEHSGEVTILGKGTVTVTATWGEVSTSYQLTISEKLTPTVENVAAKTVDVFGSPTFQPIAKMGAETLEATFSYSSGNSSVIAVSNNKLSVKAPGVASIGVKVNSTDFYDDKTENVNVTVTEPTDASKYWIETYGDFGTSYSDYVADQKTFAGKDGVLNWQVKYFQRGSADRVYRYPGTNRDYGFRLAHSGSSDNFDNYLSYLNTEEGGIKAIFFNWRRPGSNTATAKFTVYPQKAGSEAKYTETFNNVEGGSDYAHTHAYWKELNLKHNEKLTIQIPSGGNPLIFGPITIMPYLLYKTKTYAPTEADCKAANYKYTNSALINNTGKKINATQSDIQFSIVGENETTQKIAEVNEHTGEVTMRGAGTVTVQAKWGDVTTTYQLIVPKLIPTVTLAEPDAIELDETYTPKPVAKIGDYIIPNAAYTYTDIDANVAKEVEGVIYPQSPGKTDVKAVLTATSNYASANKKVSLTVNNYVPEAGTFFAETFTNVPASTSQYVYNTEKFDGDKKFDGCLYKWEVYNYRSSWSETKIALRNREDDRLGYLKMDGNFEGGIKFIAFDWKSSSPGGDVNYSVKVNEKSVPIRVPSSTADMYRFAHFFDEISNEVNLNIQMDTKSGAAAYLAICPVTIMPYLLYTRKAPAPDAETLAANNFKYENTDIINNTGVELSSAAITFEIVGENDATKKVAIIDANTGVVTCHGAGKVTVKATWKPDQNKADVVTTTYELTVPKLPITVTYSDASIDVTQNIPLPVATLGDEIIADAQFTYQTSKETVIEIKDGKPALVATGKANITATLNDDRYTSEAKTAEITVTAPPAEKCFVETFDKLENKGTSYTTSEETFNGKDDVYKWKVNEYRNSDAFGIRIRRDDKNHKEGYISMNGNQEGGIRYVTFKWQSTSANPVHFVITVNGTEYDYPYSSTQLSKDYTWGRAFNAPAKNNNFSITVKENSGAYIMVQRAVTIVPYLLYTVKTKEIKIGEKYTHSIIDNRDNSHAIAYSVTEGGEFVSVDAETGEVTGLKVGTATIQAKWGEVITTYQVSVSTEASITLDEEKDNSALIAGYDGTTGMNVTLKRKLSKGIYNTFCVPFAISKADLASALGGATVKLSTLDTDQPGELKEEGGQKNLNIVMKEVDNIEAGKPYLLEIDKDVTEPFTVENVKIVNVGKDDSYFQSSEGAVTFYGITSPFNIPNNNQYLFVSSTRLSWNNTNAAAPIKGMRAYFYAKVNSSNVSARLVFNKPQTPTELMQNIECTMQSVQKMIINDQLIIIREGNMYNAQGQTVK